MDFRLSDDQEALRDGIRTFCEGRISFEALAALEKEPVDRALWRELAEMGVFGLRRPEAEGGVGLGMRESVLVFAELGRCLAPGPLIGSQLAAPFVPGAAAGESVVGQLDLGGAAAGPILVEHAAALDHLLVLRDDGAFRVDGSALRGTPVATPLDPLTPLQHLDALPEGERLADAAAVATLRREGTVLAAALLLGIAEATVAHATDYAGKREQFDRPIGSFQAVKHMLSDMFVRQELARAAVYAAGATLDGFGVGEPDHAASVSKLVAGECAMKNARACVQVFGGMGFTWEMPPHYYLKRCWVLENGFGTAGEHADAVARELLRSAG